MAHARLALVQYGAVPVWRCSGVAQFRLHAMAQFHAVSVWPCAFSLDTNVYLNDGSPVSSFDILYRADTLVFVHIVKLGKIFIVIVKH